MESFLPPPSRIFWWYKFHCWRVYLKLAPAVWEDCLSSPTVMSPDTPAKAFSSPSARDRGTLKGGEGFKTGFS